MNLLLENHFALSGSYYNLFDFCLLVSAPEVSRQCFPVQSKGQLLCGFEKNPSGLSVLPSLLRHIADEKSSVVCLM